MRIVSSIVSALGRADSVKTSGYTKAKLAASKKLKDVATVTYTGKIKKYSGKKGRVQGFDVYGGVRLKIGDDDITVSPFACGLERPDAKKPAAKPAAKANGGNGKSGNGSQEGGQVMATTKTTTARPRLGSWVYIKPRRRSPRDRVIGYGARGFIAVVVYVPADEVTRTK